MRLTLRDLRDMFVVLGMIGVSMWAATNVPLWK